jgi:hypothetical protein
LKSPTRFIVNIHPAILISMSDRWVLLQLIVQ